MSRNAAIYVRVSSEQQGERASPSEQEADCRKLAAEQGFNVVQVYRDIERYRVKRKMVEPSGTRADRPALLAMLGDAARGDFDVILAWREDRLYRSLRAMLLVLEALQEHRLTVMLAKETFDPNMAPLKAWVAQMELKGIKERMSMGAKARLRAGKALTGQDRYGYRRVGEHIEIVDVEAGWIRQIFAWYIAHVPVLEIRRRLIEAGAPQKGGTIRARVPWSRTIIQGILASAQAYAEGKKTHHLDGETFTISVPPIIDQETYELYRRVKEANIEHPVRNLKHEYLLSGKLTCGCKRKWGARSMVLMRKNRAGKLVPQNPNGQYYCREQHVELISPDCPRTIACAKADKIAWQKVCDAIGKPEILLTQARALVDELRTGAEQIEAERDRLQKQLDDLTLERQWIITQARKGGITEEDMGYQLGALDLQGMSLKRELAAVSEAIELPISGDWEEQVREYLLDLQAGMESLNVKPQSEEDRQEIFEIKRQIVDTLVRKVTIDRARELHVEISVDLLSVLERGDFDDRDVGAQIKSSARACGRRSCEHTGAA